MVDRVVRLGLGVFIGVWIARYLGPMRYGSLNFAVSFVALFGTLTTLGLDSIAVRNILAEPTQAPEILGSAFALRLCGSFLVPVLAIAIIQLIQPNDRTALLLVGILSIGVAFQVFDTIDSYFQAQLQSKLTVWAKSASFLLIAGVRILLIHISAPLWSFAAAQATEMILGAIAMVLVYKWDGGQLSMWRVRKQRALKLFTQGWPVMLSGLAIITYMRIDVIMLKLLQGDGAVGIYAAATRVSEVWYFIPAAIVSSVTPAIIRAKDNAVVYYERIERLFALMSFIAIVIGSGVALSSHWIITALYSNQFSSAAPVLAIHVWASAFVFLGVAQGPWNLSENLMKLSLYRTLAGALANILLNSVLIPKYSAIGAAIATVVSYAIAGVLANAFDIRTRPIFLLQLKSFFPRKLWDPLKSLH